MSLSLSETKPAWVSVEEACEILKVSRATLYTLLKLGAFKTASLRRPGTNRGKRLVNADSILAYLESQATGGTGKYATTTA
jgi:excisionase family DNA binding protein